MTAPRAAALPGLLSLTYFSLRFEGGPERERQPGLTIVSSKVLGCAGLGSLSPRTTLATRPGTIAPQPAGLGDRPPISDLVGAADALGHSGNSHPPGPLGAGMSEVGYWGGNEYFMESGKRVFVRGDWKAV